jgi:hypothetical protein
MTRNPGLGKPDREGGELVKVFIILMILAILIDSRIYSCLLWLWQVPCIIYHDIKIFPGRRWGARIRETALAIINHITRKSYFIFNLKEGSHGNR